MNTTSPAPERKPLRPGFDPQLQPFQVADHADGVVLMPIAHQQLSASVVQAHFETHNGFPLARSPEHFDESSFRYPGREGQLTPASVLVGLVQRKQPTVLFTQRTAHLNDHAGQISFPGGRAEPDDADAVATALRESCEEVGLRGQDIHVIGRLPHYITGTGYEVTPVVALLQPDFVCKPDPFEVQEVFEVPLAFLMNPAHHRRHTITLPNGTQRTYYSMPSLDVHAGGQGQERFIWGATAGMLRMLYYALQTAR